MTAQMSATSREPDGPLVFTTVKNAAGFRAYADSQLGILAGPTAKRADVRFIDDPMSAVEAPGAKSDLFVWINGDVLAASPRLAALRQVASNARAATGARFADGSFRSRIAEVYHEGAGFIVAADLERIIATSRDTMRGRVSVPPARHKQSETLHRRGEGGSGQVLQPRGADVQPCGSRNRVVACGAGADGRSSVHLT